MTVTSAVNANTILNRVAAEVGLQAVTDPYSSQEQHFVQMRYLLQTCGETLALAHEWEFLTREFSIQTQVGDDGNYPLPPDWMSMQDQTGWERAQNVPLGGPLSAQDWQFLIGQDLGATTLYASFRLKDGKISIFPQPPPAGLDIVLEYRSRNWVSNGEIPPVYKATVDTGSDIVLFDRTLITRALKNMWLEAKGFDTTGSQADYNQVFNFLIGKDKGGRVLSAGKSGRGFPYLSPYGNTPNTGYGL